MRKPEPIPVDLGRKAEYTLDRVPVTGAKRVKRERLIEETQMLKKKHVGGLKGHALTRVQSSSLANCR